MNGAGKWKINVTKLYGDAMNLFFVAANMTEVVKNVVNVFKHVFRAFHSLTVETIMNDDYFSSLFLVLLKIV